MWGKERGIWFGGMLGDRAVVLSGSEVHATGVRPRGEELPPMSDLPDQSVPSPQTTGRRKAVGLMTISRLALQSVLRSANGAGGSTAA